MRVDALHYELPPELIAQHPPEGRELARLMCVPVAASPAHARVSELPELLPRGSLVVLNDTRVIAARLLGRKRDTGGRVEILLLRPIETRELEVAPGQWRAVEVWRALGKATKPLRFGVDVEVPPRSAESGSALFVRLLGRADEDGLLDVAVWTSSASPVGEALNACGHVPLPPYIKRDDVGEDASRYQTVYARHDGAVAAPTAGLHLTEGLLARFSERGIDVATLTLHVGLGTFQPVRVDDLDDHPMHAERYTVPEGTADAIAGARNRGGLVVAVGTTTARALESASDPDRAGFVRPTSGETRLLIQPGYSWRVVDGLVTNFHQPRSTLLALVCSFAGVERVLEAYRLAVRERYRFFSYGDAMLLWRPS